MFLVRHCRHQWVDDYGNEGTKKSQRLIRRWLSLIARGRLLLLLRSDFCCSRLALPDLQRLDLGAQLGNLLGQSSDVLLRRHVKAVQRTRNTIFEHLLELVPSGVCLGARALRGLVD